MKMPDFLLPDDLLIEPLLGADAEGAAYGPPLCARGRVRPGARLAADAHALSPEDAGTVYLSPQTPLKVGDRICYAGRTAQVASVRALRNPDGSLHHLEAVIL